MRRALMLVMCLGACATGGGQEAVATACEGADWEALGERDGLYGEPEEKFAERAAECSAGAADGAVDYVRGRSKGLAAYCMPSAGFDAGRNGRAYRQVCPADLEAAFLTEFRTGWRLHELTTALASAKAALETAKARIEPAKYDLRDALDRYNDSDLSEGTREAAGADVERFRREIELLEADLPRLIDAVPEAERQLKDYRASFERRSD